MVLQSLIEKIQDKLAKNKNLLIAIDGRSGSGKSNLAQVIKHKLSNVEIVHLDIFEMYEGESSFKKVLKEIIMPLKNNESIEYKDNNGVVHTIDPVGIIILEGVFSLNKSMFECFDFKIWIDCPVEVGYKRGLSRDINLNGLDNSDKWKTYWIPKEEQYIKTEKPQNKADVSVDGTKPFI